MSANPRLTHNGLLGQKDFPLPCYPLEFDPSTEKTDAEKKESQNDPQQSDNRTESEKRQKQESSQY